MKTLAAFFFAACACSSLAQQHDLKPSEALKNLSFLSGNWKGTQDFNTRGGAAMSGVATDRIEMGIAGHYVCETLSTTLPGSKPTDTRHFIGYDPSSGNYRAWWFTDTSPSPLEFTGKLEGKKLTLETSGPTVLKATYEVGADDKFTYTLEMQQGSQWIRLFTSTYSRT